MGLWCLHPWRYPEAFWTQSWATGSRWLCWSRGVGPDYHHRSLPTSAILWFCDSVILWFCDPIYWQNNLSNYNIAFLEKSNFGEKKKKDKPNQLMMYLSSLPPSNRPCRIHLTFQKLCEGSIIWVLVCTTNGVQIILSASGNVLLTPHQSYGHILIKMKQLLSFFWPFLLPGPGFGKPNLQLRGRMQMLYS